MDTAIRTLRPETSKRGRPSAPRPPTSAGSSQRDLDAPALAAAAKSLQSCPFLCDPIDGSPPGSPVVCC